MKLQIKELSSNSKIPTRGYITDSGLDLFSIENVELKSFERKVVKTGISVKLPEPTKVTTEDGSELILVWEAQIRPKSGRSAKEGLMVVNTPGTIDSTYSGEIMVILYNSDPHSSIVIENNQKIAQMVISPVVIPNIEIVDEIQKSERSINGFGSTGLK